MCAKRLRNGQLILCAMAVKKITKGTTRQKPPSTADDENKVLQRVYDFFLQSSDFNGIPLKRLSKEVKLSYLSVIEIVKDLVIKGHLSIQTGTNPHIIALGHYRQSAQLELLDKAKANKTKVISKIKGISVSFDSHLTCFYPTQEYLEANRNTDEFSNSPFSKELALGAAHLSARYFDIEVLERYFHDPRLDFKFEDYSGGIIYKDDENNQPSVRESDQVFLKTFGLGHDESGNRVAVVYLRYLADLTPEHQVYWKGKQSMAKCMMVKEYYANTIEGSWTTSRSVFTAFLAEQLALNKLCKAIFDKELFRKTFERETRPREFTFFFVPTQKNYDDFILLLDKMLSDNLNKDFFDGIDSFEITKHADGSIERKEKGTLRLLEEWLNHNITMQTEGGIAMLMKPLKSVRKERQNPAHRISSNEYNKAFVDQQKKQLGEAYRSIRNLRNLFQGHPDAYGVEIPKWLDEGHIKFF